MMKIHIAAFMLVSIVLSFATATAQCGMGMGAGHNHGGTSAPAGHEGHKASNDAVSSKAYAFINDDGNQEATIVIKDGYQPDTVVVKKGIPVRLNFDLQEKGCTGTVVFDDFGIEQELKQNELTAVEFTPNAAGEFAFHCPMNMIAGTLIVKE